MADGDDSGIILHHYDASPFSQKVRMVLGLKGLAWRSVVTPNMMPKPDLIPLTGGYRRAPVMQIGADIFCDSQVCVAEIERRWPGHARGAVWPVNLWSDRLFFQTSVMVIFGRIGDRIDPAFAADRERLSGRPFDAKAMAAMAGPAQAQWRGHAAWIAQALEAGGTPFLGGDAPGLSDVAAFMNVWFVTNTFPDLADMLTAGLALDEWRGAMAAIGEGDRREIDGTAALDEARTREPAAAPPHDAADPLAPAPGSEVSVAADDYGRDPIAGRLVAATRDRIVITRDGGDLGALQSHFPRVGYLVTPR